MRIHTRTMEENPGKKIQLEFVIPIDEQVEIPDFSMLSQNETLLLFKIITNIIKDLRKDITLITHEEIYNKVKEETKEEIRQTEINALVERKFAEKVKEDADQRVLKAQDELNAIRAQLKEMRQEAKTLNKEFIDEQVKIVSDKFEATLKEKDRQNKLEREMFEKCSMVINNLTAVKTSAELGQVGESKFEELANTFNDFEDYEIIDTHKESNKGDFHLMFKEFNVLVDAKNYKSNVPSNQKEKIKANLLANPHMHFAWLISLNTDIDNCKKSPVTYELVEGRYAVYVNNLLQYKNPQKFLRILWSNCKELKRLIIDEEEEEDEDMNAEKEELKEHKLLRKKEIEKIKGYIKSASEMNKTIKSLLKMTESMQISMKESIDEDTKKITGEDVSDITLLEEWWDKNVEFMESDEIIKSTDIWYKFKSDNEGKIDNIDVQRFKQMLIQHLDSIGHHDYVRIKGKTSAIEIKNYRLKTNSVVTKKEKVINIVTEQKTGKKSNEVFNAIFNKK